MPLHDHSVYQYRSAWIGNLANMGVSFIRGTYKPGFAPTYETARLLRERRMKWNMVLVTDLRQSDADIVARVKDIASKAADVCVAVEGINEPNHNRSGGSVPSNWRELTLQKQKVLWQAVQASSLRGKPVLGPSLQMQRVKEADFAWFASHGLNNYMTHAGTHCYPTGRYIDTNFDSATRTMRKYWHKPVWITETGYTNALDDAGGQRPVPEWVAGVYAPSAALEAIDRGWKVNWFEVMDDFDAGARNEVEANYGLYAVGSSMSPSGWRAKPAAIALKGILNGLKDPGPAFKPRTIGLRVAASTADVRWTALGKRDGSVRLYLRRTAEVYNSDTDRKIAVADARVTITTAKGTRTVSVGPEVVSVLL